MASGRPGPRWEDPEWFVGHVDGEDALSDAERYEVAEHAQRWRKQAHVGEFGSGSEVYASAWALVARLRAEYDVEHRAPIPAVEPIDLDGLDRPSDPSPVLQAHGPNGVSPPVSLWRG